MPSIMLESRRCIQRLQNLGICLLGIFLFDLNFFNEIGLRKLVLLCVCLFVMFDMPSMPFGLWR